MRDSEITSFDNDYVYAALLTGPNRGIEQKIPRDMVQPQEWIAVGERIWHVEHGYWNFHRMFDEFYGKQLKRIKEKLSYCRKHDLEAFGSESHQYKLRSCLSDANIRLFEEKHKILLPLDFRYFLQHCGNGGAGPYYGIYPLDDTLSFAGWMFEDLSDDYISSANHLKTSRNELPDLADDKQRRDLYQGTISIGTQGCSYEILLIVSGDRRGRVVYADSDDAGPYVCHDNNFLDWYERWLDELIAGYNMHSYGYGIPGGAKEFFDVLDSAYSSDEDKSEAARSFIRLPSLGDDDAKRLYEYINHPLTDVRIGICMSMRVHKLKMPEELTNVWISDSDSRLRNQAVFTLGDDLEHNREKLFNILQTEKDKDVASSAYHVLRDVLTDNELRWLLEHSPHEEIRYSALYQEWAEDDEELLLALTDDQQRIIKTTAIQKLRHINPERALPRVVNALNGLRGRYCFDDRYLIDTCIYFLRDFGQHMPEESAAALLYWLESDEARDDFVNSGAVGALSAIGDLRVLPYADKLAENGLAERKSAEHGLHSQSSQTLHDIVRTHLLASPNPAIAKAAAARYAKGEHFIAFNNGSTKHDLLLEMRPKGRIFTGVFTVFLLSTGFLGFIIYKTANYWLLLLMLFLIAVLYRCMTDMTDTIRFYSDGVELKSAFRRKFWYYNELGGLASRQGSYDLVDNTGESVLQIVEDVYAEVARFREIFDISCPFVRTVISWKSGEDL